MHSPRSLTHAVIPLVCLVLGSCMATPMQPAAAPDPYSVEVVLATNTVRTGYAVPATFRVTNISNTTQSFKAMSCSWKGDWRSNHPQVGMAGWACTENYLVTETLAPGQSYERSAEVYSNALVGPVTFQFGFKPRDTEKTYWSNEVILNTNLFADIPPASASPSP